MNNEFTWIQKKKAFIIIVWKVKYYLIIWKYIVNAEKEEIN